MKNSTIVNNSEIILQIRETLSQVIDHSIDRVVIIDESLGDLYHRIPRLITLLEGQRTYHYVVDGKQTRISIKPGEIYYILPTGFFEPAPEDPSHSKFLSILYYPDYIRSIILHCPRDGSHTREDRYLHTDQGMDSFGCQLLELFNKIPRPVVEDQTVMVPFMRSLLAQTHRMLTDNQPTEKIKRSHTVWSAMNKYLIDHFEEPMSRDELAEIFRVTPNYVSNLFKRYTGMSFSDSCTNYRLQRAATLLSGSRLSVKEIGCICGYNHTSYFIKLFRKQYGVTPAKYQANYTTEQ